MSLLHPFSIMSFQILFISLKGKFTYKYQSVYDGIWIYFIYFLHFFYQN